MGSTSSAQPHKKQTSDGKWDVVYTAMVVISIAGLAYILVKQ
jgi:hypothetical protein